MYTGYIPRMLLFKKRQFRVHHLLLTSVQILTPECHLVIAGFDPMAIVARPTMN
jgi:hypothetical protein